jgi:hypothetical protein
VIPEVAQVTKVSLQTKNSEESVTFSMNSFYVSVLFCCVVFGMKMGRTKCLVEGG